MKAGTLLQDVEGVAMIAGLGIAAFLIWKGYTTAKGIANTGGALADKVSQVYTTARTAAANSVTETEVAVKKLLNPDATISVASGKDGLSTRADAVNLLNGLRTAKAVSDSTVWNAPVSLWSDLKDWYAADTTGKAVRESFYAKNPEGVFYD